MFNEIFDKYQGEEYQVKDGYPFVAFRIGTLHSATYFHYILAKKSILNPDV